MKLYTKFFEKKMYGKVYPKLGTKVKSNFNLIFKFILFPHKTIELYIKFIR